MSYILDALKRAEVERGQTRAPNHAEPAQISAPIAPQSHGHFWRWSMAIALLVLAGVAYIVWPSSSASGPSRAIDEPAPLAAPPPAPPIAVVSAAAPQAAPPPASLSAPVQPILAPAPALPRPSPAANASSDAPKRAPQAPATVRPAPAPVVPQSAAPAKPMASVLPAAPTKPPALSAAQRTGMPDITISGSSYSANPAHRMLIANNKVIKEGQELAPGLTLEVIGPRSAVFNQGGMRFNINY